MQIYKLEMELKQLYEQDYYSDQDYDNFNLMVGLTSIISYLDYFENILTCFYFSYFEIISLNKCNFTKYCGCDRNINQHELSGNLQTRANQPRGQKAIS